MAEKIAQNPLFLHEINQAINTGKCFKSFMEYSKDVTESLFLQKFTDYVENLGEKLETYGLQKSKQAANVSENASNISIGDEIIYNLNMLWDIFSRAELKQRVCPLFLKLFKVVCKENGCLLVFLRNCLNCHDHFIAFQSYKVFCKVYKCFPDLVICVRFEELLKMSLSDDGDNCGQWLPIYTAEIMKGLFIGMEGYMKFSTFSENSSKTQRHASCCLLDDENSNEICTKDIKGVLYCHWLKLTNHYSAKLVTVLKGEDVFARRVCGYGFDPFQQILTTMLSYGRTFIESCDFLLANRKLADTNTHAEKTIQQISGNRTLTINCGNIDLSVGETSNSAKCARICDSENLSDSKFTSKDDYVAQSIHRDDVTCTHDCKLKLFERIVIHLVEIDHKKCSLHFSRTVFQFVNDFASAISEHCFGRGSTNFSYEGTQRVAGICSNLVERCNMLLGNMPQVMGKVHFGGQDNSGEQETSDVGSQSYDEVCLRKVLLLVLKLMLVTLHAQNDSSKIIQWQALKQPLESWLNFVTEISHPQSQSVAVRLVELFSDQDDELVYLLFCLLQLYQKLFCGESSEPVPSWASHLHISLNPHVVFMEFLTSINYDHSLLLDFLISNETHFLPYFYNYLRHLANDWPGFKETLDQRQILSKEDKQKTLGAVQVPEGNSVGFLSASTKLFCGTVKSFSADAGDNGDGCDDGSGNSDGDIIGDNDGNNVNSDCGGGVLYGGCGSGDEIGDGNGDNDGYKNSDDGDNDGYKNSDDGDNDGYKNSDDDDGEGGVVFSNMNNLQQTLTCLIRLRYSIERMSCKGLFPYPVTALVKVMEYIETVYEGEG